MRDFLERAQAAVGDDGRLPLGPMAGWETFPFEGDGLRARPLTEHAVPEPDRRKPPERCGVCRAVASPDLLLHEGEQLAVVRPGGSSLLFTANVASKEHRPLDDLDADGLAEMGVLIGRTYAAMRALPGVGNVHVNKWENGGGHLAVVLLARPEGVLQLRGSHLTTWADMLPPTPTEELDARAETVRQALEGA